MESPTETKLRKEVANLLFSKLRHASEAIIAKVRERDAGEIERLRAQVAAGKLMADFAKGAIHDAIATEEGLDGDAGQGVMCIISEWQEHGTFDNTLCEHMTSFEKIAATALDEDAYHEIESLKRQLAESRAAPTAA